MTRRFGAVLAAVLAVSVTSQAFGQEPPPPPPPPPPDELVPAPPSSTPSAWSLYSGRTAGKGNFIIGPELGYPGIGSYFVYGIGEGFDIGGKFVFNYGTEVAVAIAPTLNLQGVLRLRLVNTGLLSLGVQFEPGIGFFFDSGGGLLIHFPLGLEMGIHPSDMVAILLGLELRSQILVGFGGGAAFVMPILLVNPGVEFKFAENLALTFRTGFGPGVVAGANGAGVGFSFRALVGVAIKL